MLLPCVFDLAAQLGLTERPYFFVLSARAGRGLYFLLPGRRDQLAGRLAYIAIDRVQPADSRFATALTDPSFSEPGFYRTAVVLFSTMAHFTLVGAERRMYTYGFGVDSAHTRLEVLRGVASISPSDSTTGLMQSVAYFDNGMTSGSHRVAALLPASTAVSYQAFAILGVRVPLAVIDPTALSRLAAPQPNDYSSLASSGETGGSGADDSTLAFLTLLAVPLAAFVGLLLWRRRQRQQEVQKEADTAIRLALPDGIEQSPPLAVIGPERLAVAQKWSMGTFSRVLLGVLDGETPVILKQWQLLERSPPEAVSQTTAQLRAEWQTVADMHYVPQVLGVYGFLGPSDRLTGVVVECCSAGDLHSFLLDESVSAATLCCLAADVAAGMAALVEAGAVHYDLTARRIYVLDGGRRCKLAHFGEGEKGSG